MYPPPPPPVVRHGVPGLLVAILAGVAAILGLVGGCAVGISIGTSAEQAANNRPGAAAEARTSKTQRTASPSQTSMPSPTPSASTSPTKPAKPPTPKIEDGTHRVPQDVKPGTYRTSGGSTCYWARLRNLTGELDAIIANGNPTGSAVVTIRKSDKGFESERCGTWKKLD